VYQVSTYVIIGVAAADGLVLAESILDEVLLGSVAVVSAALSTGAEVHSRPLFVAKAAEFLSQLQLVALLNPGMRRGAEAEAEAADDEGQAGEEEEGEGGQQGLPAAHHQGVAVNHAI
jgi:hypothetical protein